MSACVCASVCTRALRGTHSFVHRSCVLDVRCIDRCRKCNLMFQRASWVRRLRHRQWKLWVLAGWRKRLDTGEVTSFRKTARTKKKGWRRRRRSAEADAALALSLGWDQTMTLLLYQREPTAAPWKNQSLSCVSGAWRPKIWDMQLCVCVCVCVCS